MNKSSVRASFVPHAQLPAVGVFLLGLFVRFEFERDGALRSLVEVCKSKKLFKRSVSRVLGVFM